MTFDLLLRAALGLLAVGAVGRVCLSLLPPGWPGDHGLRELGATWAASHALGLIALTLQIELTSRAGLQPGAWSLLSPWAGAAILRAALLPGAMRPRHEPRAERRSPLVLAVAAAAALSYAGPLWRAALQADPTAAGPLEAVLGPWVRAGTLPALGAALCGGLERGRRAALGRALVVLALAWVPPLRRCGPELPSVFLFAAGAAGAVAWMRRADRRAALLSILCLAGGALLEPAAFALSAVLVAALLASSHTPARELGVAALALAGARWLASAGAPPMDAWRLLLLLSPVGTLVLGLRAIPREGQRQSTA